MDWTVFWTAFGAIGGTVGALATAVAVVVALWQTKYSQKKKLKLSFCEGISVVVGSEDVICRYIALSATNIGNRDVVISSWGVNTHAKEAYQFVNDNAITSKLIQVDLPHKLSVEENIQLFYDKSRFLHILKAGIENKEFKPDRLLEFYVVDSTGKQYFVKTSKSVKEMIEQIEK